MPLTPYIEVATNNLPVRGHNGVGLQRQVPPGQGLLNRWSQKEQIVL